MRLRKVDDDCGDRNQRCGRGRDVGNASARLDGRLARGQAVFVAVGLVGAHARVHVTIIL